VILRPNVTVEPYTTFDWHSTEATVIVFLLLCFSTFVRGSVSLDPEGGSQKATLVVLVVVVVVVISSLRVQKSLRLS